MKNQNRIALVKGDITKIKVDAIVNAANSRLVGGGGVDGAIHRVGGTKILEECRQIIKWIEECATGTVAMTTAGKLPAKNVIHAVGPIWQGGTKNEAELLRSCYVNALKMAVKYNLKTISFPNISTGVYRFPKVQAGEIAIQTVMKELDKFPKIEQVIFVVFDNENLKIYERIFEELGSEL